MSKIGSILIIAPSYFGLERSIVDAASRSHTSVYHIKDRPFDYVLYHFFVRFFPRVSNFLTAPYFLLEFRKIRSIDRVLVINGQSLNPILLKYAKKKFFNAKFFLYLWDSLENRPSIKRSLKYYERVCSFDYGDCSKYGFTYVELFSDIDHTSINQSNNHPQYLLSFIGTMHTDRCEVVKRILKSIDGEVFICIYLKSDFLYKLFRTFSRRLDGLGREFFTFQPIPMGTVRDIFNRSIAVLDIAHPRQSGLTHRSITTLLQGRKLITTNPAILKSRLYNANNVFVIDRNNPEITSEFFSSPVQVYASELLSDYCVDGWLVRVISL